MDARHPKTTGAHPPARRRLRRHSCAASTVRSRDESRGPRHRASSHRRLWRVQLLSVRRFEHDNGSVPLRLSRDLAFDLAYTWASNMATSASMHCCGGGEQAQDNDNRSQCGPTTFFVRHSAPTVYELPFARLAGGADALPAWRWAVAGEALPTRRPAFLPITRFRRSRQRPVTSAAIPF
jgi:hypothetical protein